MAKKKGLKLESSLKELVEEHFSDDRSEPFLVPGGGLRASAFADLCPREETLRAVYRVPKQRTIDAGLNLIFAHGTALHTALQNSILPRLPGVLYGRWECNCCHTVHGSVEDPVMRPEFCGPCGTDTFTYEEFKFWDDELRLGGHPDGFIKLDGRDGFGILEAKSISPQRAWKVKALPDMSHVIQSHIYMMFTGFKWAVILYWDKGGFGTSALIEHYVERDEDTIDQIKSAAKTIWGTLDPYWAECQKNWALGLPPPQQANFPERICTSKDCPRAEECGVANLCFAGVA